MTQPSNVEPPKVALVTGGCRGIGLGIARSLAAAGYDLCLNGRRSAQDVDAVLAELRSTGAEVRYLSADIGSAADRERFVTFAEQQFEAITLLVNNAGVSSRDRGVDMLDASATNFEWLMNINLHGPFFLTQRVARTMIAQRQRKPEQPACIVNITSVSARVVSTNRADYCISKAALSMATQLWAARLADDGIPVYEIQPGIIHSDMTASVGEKYDRLIADGLTLEPRWGEPADIGRAVATLARGDLSYATGQVLTIDGGLTMRRL